MVRLQAETIPYPGLTSRIRKHIKKSIKKKNSTYSTHWLVIILIVYYFTLNNLCFCDTKSISIILGYNIGKSNAIKCKHIIYVC